MTTKCAHCSKAILPHHVCPHCGYYKGRQVVQMKVKGKNEPIAVYELIVG